MDEKTIMNNILVCFSRENFLFFIFLLRKREDSSLKRQAHQKKEREKKTKKEGEKESIESRDVKQTQIYMETLIQGEKPQY